MTAQVYVKSDEKYTSVLVSRGSNVYYSNTFESSELSGIQRGVSFVKHNLDSDDTEIYPDKLDVHEVLKDEYISCCGKNPKEGKNPNNEMIRICNLALQQKNRWNIKQFLEKQNG